VGEADVRELAICLRIGEELSPELMEQPAEDLADGETVAWESS
jgi:hypothetical protein